MIGIYVVCTFFFPSFLRGKGLGVKSYFLTSVITTTLFFASVEAEEGI